MASPAGGRGGLFYQPEPHEMAYYDGLFQSADVQRAGSIGGQQAVAFFSRSKLPMEQLKNVWTVADNPPTNSLDRQKFAVALRLIQLLQNGQKGQGSNLAAPPGVVLRPVFLEGISGAQVPMPPPPQQQQQPPQRQPPPGAQTGGYPQQQRGGPPPPGSPSGGPQPPPQQQQQRAPQTPQQQQQQYQVPPAAAGGRPPVPPVPSQTSTTALAVQDPFSMTPNEQSRYDTVFPQYAKEDGFVHGREAVELFSKSGLNHTQLRDIWNMVDHPVDNKLDRLEFGMAMHLIVCISKKNLPFPKVLPLSLKALKQQQAPPPGAQAPPLSPMAQVQQQHPAGGITPSPSTNLQQQGMAMPQQHMPMVPHIQQQQEVPRKMTTPENAVSGMTGPSTLQGPPSLQSVMGGMDISDAFEGLNMTGSGASASGFGNDASNEPSYSMGGGFGASQDRHSPPVQVPKSPPRVQQKLTMSFDNQSASAQSVPETAKTSHDLAHSYNMEDAPGELGKLKTVLQKLQAENISLKAQLGTMSDEEKDIQKEVNAVVHEIGELSNRLTTLRAEVLAAKSRLLSATAELKAAQEKKGVLKDLISDAEATKTAIDTAYYGIEAAAQAAQAPALAPAPAPMYEQDLFGFGGPAPAPQVQYNHAAPAPAPAPFPVQMSQGQDHGSGGGNYGAPKGVETVSSDESTSGDQFDANPEEDESMHNDLGQGNDGAFGYSAGITYGGNAPIISGLDDHMKNQSNFGHQKQQNSISSNLSFDMGPVLGGAAAPIPANDQFSHVADPVQVGSDLGPGPSLDDINELKSKAKEAEDVARDAAETLRQLNARADQLRTMADKAEADARQKEADAAEPPKKKKGFMGVGGGGGGGVKKKQSMKEALQAKQDAEAKKKEFLAAQSQANDAQVVAMETKREAEKLRKEAENLELKAASVASMQQSQPPAHPANGYQQQEEKQPIGYGQQQSYAQPTDSGHSYAFSGGFGSQPLGGYGGGFNPNVMSSPSGGGGIMIPTPTGTTNAPDPYGNPFQ